MVFSSLAREFICQPQSTSPEPPPTRASCSSPSSRTGAATSDFVSITSFFVIVRSLSDCLLAPQHVAATTTNQGELQFGELRNVASGEIVNCLVDRRLDKVGVRDDVHMCAPEMDLLKEGCLVQRLFD